MEEYIVPTPSTVFWRTNAVSSKCPRTRTAEQDERERGDGAPSGRRSDPPQEFAAREAARENRGGILPDGAARGQVRGRSRATLAADQEGRWTTSGSRIPLSGFALVAGIVGRSITVAEARRADDVGRRPKPPWARRGGSSGSWCDQARSGDRAGTHHDGGAGSVPLVGEGNWWLLASLLLFVAVGALVPLVLFSARQAFRGRDGGGRDAGTKVTPHFAQPSPSPTRQSPRPGSPRWSASPWGSP